MGHARALDDRVIALALDQAAAWLGRPRLPPVIAINVTAESLTDPTFPGRLGVALVARGLESARIEIEIPEAIAIRDLHAVGPQLAALRALGVRLALDDFGAGHSSLAHALRLPVQRLKLDRSIVSELPQGARSRAMLRAITALARSMEIELLAEGVETEAPLAETFEIGAFTVEPGKKGYRADAVIALERRALVSGRQEIRLVLDREPRFIGVDPFNGRIDRNSNDNLVKVGDAAR
jgi:EAL domain-containing protein (putative c-di-GMP-specific phosphodiesterase class I)